jgi:hypothetical protein
MNIIYVGIVLIKYGNVWAVVIQRKHNMDNDEYRRKEKEKMYVLLFWMFIIGWCLALHYFAYVGVMSRIQ